MEWTSVDPVLEITAADNVMVGTLDAALVEEDSGTDAGSIHVEFHAPVCWIEGMVDTVVGF